jgi:hypothetical protein
VANFPIIQKDPSAFLAYGFDLAVAASGGKPYLAQGETITAVAVTADPGVTVVSSGVALGAGGALSQVFAWVRGGVYPNQYNVHYFFTTSLGNQDTRTLTLQMVSK